MKKVIILAAGKPHYGSNPSIFFNQNKYFNNFDVLKNILSEYSPVYYTAFVYSTEGKVSSGAIAIAFASSNTGQASTDFESGGITPAIPNPPEKVIQATSWVTQERVTPDMRLPGLSEVFVFQNGREWSFIDPHMSLGSTQAITVRVPVQSVAGNLKSIIGTLLDPTNNELSYSFLLRVNENKTYYEAVVPPLLVVGESVLEIVIYDYEAFTVATYKSPITFADNQQLDSVVLFPDMFFQGPVYILLLSTLLGTVLLTLLLIFRYRHEDKA